MKIRVAPGAGSVIASRATLALVDGPPSEPLVQALLGPVLQGKAVEEVIDVLKGHVDSSRVGVGVIFVDPSRTIVLLRGRVACRASRSDGTFDLSADVDSESPWDLFAVSEPLSLALHIADEDPVTASWSPLASGITSGGMVAVGLVEPSGELGVAMGVVTIGEPHAVAIGSPSSREPTNPFDGSVGAGAVPSSTLTSSTTGLAKGTIDAGLASASATTAPASPENDLDVEIEELPDWPPPPPDAGSEAARELSDLLGATTFRGSVAKKALDAPTTGTRPLRLPDGSVVLVGPLTVLGRNPPPDARIDDRPATSVRVPDPDRALSRQHLAIRVSETGVSLEDLGSTNRSAIDVPGRVRQDLVPGEPVSVPPGTVVILGGSVSLVVDPR